MRQLLPEPLDDVDVVAAYESIDRAPSAPRPWVMVNMIASVDGATSVDGASAGLGGPADKAVFDELRSLPDVILVAAGTVRAEHYGPPRPSVEAQQRRQARGQRPSPRLAIVTRRLDLDPGAALFRDAAADARPLVLTTETAAAGASDALRAVADVRAVGVEGVDLDAALQLLHDEGLAAVVLCEGGPSLNGELVAAGLVDELCLSLSPLLVGGSSARLAHGPGGFATRLELVRVLEADDLLFLDYVRAPVAT